MIPNAQQYKLVDLRPPSYDLTAPDGAVMNPADFSGQLLDFNGNPVLTDPSQPLSANNPPVVRGTGIVKHWMDSQLASAWFSDARAKLNAGNIMGALQSMMWAFNALNITWYSHPDSRRLWRKYIAGPPQLIAGSSFVAEYGNHNYNDGWFSVDKPNSAYPGWGCGPHGCVSMPSITSYPRGTTSMGSGLVTDQTWALAQRVPDWGIISKDPLAAAYVELSPTLWPFLNVPRIGSGPGGYQVNPVNNLVLNDPTIALDIQNSMVASGFVDEQQGNPDDNIIQPNGAFRNVNTPAGPNVDCGGNVQNCSNMNDLFMFSNPQIGGYKVIGVPFGYYGPWLDEWISTMQSKTPEILVSEARTYVAYCNNKSAAAYGGNAAFFRAVGNVPAIEDLERTTGGLQTGLKATATAATAVGGALAGFTFGISALIGGAVSLGLNIAAVTVRNAVNLPRDEFGRSKPLLERGWLSGNPGDLTNGTPLLSLFAPDGFVRAGSGPMIAFGPNVNLASVGYLQGRQSVGPGTAAPPPTGSNVPAPSTTQPSRVGRTVLWLAIGGGAAYVGYKLLVKPPPAQNNPLRSRRGRR